MGSARGSVGVGEWSAVLCAWLVIGSASAPHMRVRTSLRLDPAWVGCEQAGREQSGDVSRRDLAGWDVGRVGVGRVVWARIGMSRPEVRRANWPALSADGARPRWGGSGVARLVHGRLMVMSWADLVGRRLCRWPVHGIA